MRLYLTVITNNYVCMFMYKIIKMLNRGLYTRHKYNQYNQLSVIKKVFKRYYSICLIIEEIFGDITMYKYKISNLGFLFVKYYN